jgi:hypothetical protein
MFMWYLWNERLQTYSLLVHTMHIIPVTSACARYAQCHTCDIFWCILCTSYPCHLLVHTMHVISVTSAGAHYAQRHTYDLSMLLLTLS